MTGILKTNFGGMTIGQFSILLGRVVPAMTDNDNFEEPWWSNPAETPTSVSLKTDAAALAKIEERAADGDKATKELYKTKRSAIESELQKLVACLELKAKGDRAMLETTGFELRRLPAHISGPGLPPAPQNLRAVRGEVSGLIILRCVAVKGAGSYETQLCTGDETVEANWHTVAQTKGCRRIEITGLTAGTIYKFRIRAIGSKGPGAWAESASIMAV